MGVGPPPFGEPPPLPVGYPALRIAAHLANHTFLALTALCPGFHNELSTIWHMIYNTGVHLMGSPRAEVMAFVSLHCSSKAGCSAGHAGKEKGGQ